MKTRDEALARLDRALAEARAAGCDGADAFLAAGRSALTRFAAGAIHQNVAWERETLVLRVANGSRIGCVHTDVLTDEGLRAAARKAAEIAASSAEDAEFPGFVASPVVKPCAVFDEATAAASPEDRARLVRGMIGRIGTGGAAASGSLSTGAGVVAAANTAGTRQFDRSTSAALNLVAMDGTAAGCATWSGARLGELDANGRAAFALGKCLASRGAAGLDPGEYAVVLEPAATATLVEFLAYLGFGAQRMQQGRSCLQGKIGQRVADECVSIVDDARDPAGLPFPFDAEGVPTRRVELITKGVAKGVVHDTRTAAKEGVESTGHAAPAPNAWGPFPEHLAMAQGDSSLEEMIASTGRGLLVSRFHYTNVAEPSTATITGMTRYGLFEIAGGEVARPVRNLRFTQSVLAALADVEAVGRARERFGGDWGSGAGVVPALRIARFRFTGRSDH